MQPSRVPLDSRTIAPSFRARELNRRGTAGCVRGHPGEPAQPPALCQVLPCPVPTALGTGQWETRARHRRLCRRRGGMPCVPCSRCRWPTTTARPCCAGQGCRARPRVWAVPHEHGLPPRTSPEMIREEVLWSLLPWSGMPGGKTLAGVRGRDPGPDGSWSCATEQPPATGPHSRGCTEQAGCAVGNTLSMLFLWKIAKKKFAPHLQFNFIFQSLIYSFLCLRPAQKWK